MSFTNFTTGKSHSFGGEYLELVPHARIRYTDKFDDPNLPGEIHVTVILRPVSVGTELTIEQEGLPDVIPLGGLLSWLAAVAHEFGQTCRARNPKLIVRGCWRRRLDLQQRVMSVAGSSDR